MSIAEKLVTIAENQPKVYDAGKQAENDRFWDAYQDYGNRKEYPYAFSYSAWTDDYFMPKYDIVTTNAEGMFMHSGNGDISKGLTNVKELLKKAGVVLDTSQASKMIYFCYLSKSITHLPKISHEGCTDVNSTFWNSNVESIDELVLKEDGTNTFGKYDYNKPFYICKKLSHMIVSGTIGNSGLDVQWSPLDHDSLMSIINALQTKTSGTWTVTLGTSNLAKLTDAEKAIGTQKGWTLA